MTIEQGTLFNQKAFKGSLPQNHTIKAPTATMTVNQTLSAYYAFLSSISRSQYTPNDFHADLKLFGQFTSPRPLCELQIEDIQQWIAKLKETMQPKTVSRKIAALSNYFRWLDAAKVLTKNPAESIFTPKVHAPLPDILFDNECEALLTVASNNPRTYLLIKLLLETGLKTSELLELRTTNFDFSNKYQPVLWVKHTSRQVVKDRKRKLPADILPVYDDYIKKYDIEGLLFPYTNRFLQEIIKGAATTAGLHKEVSPRLLRDVFIVRCRKRGEAWDTIFDKVGLSKMSHVDAIRKYGRLASAAL
jgi:site-specific recombinase XerD